MFDFGFFEGVVIVVLLLIVVKPEDLPKLFRKIGNAYGKCQRLYYRFRNELDEFASFDEDIKK
jgi:sec-independent protein translocase protein TatB